MSWCIAVDIGGTFTDFYAVEPTTGRAHVFKRPSTPHDPSEALIDGLKETAETYSIPLDQVEALAHGTTVATNTLIQRKGAPVALITTEGFRDLLEIGRQIRPHVYSLQIDQPEPLVPRKWRLDLPERIGGKGEVVRPLDEQALRELCQEIRESDREAVAVCFLFSFFNPVHEEQAAKIIEEELPDISKSFSYQVQPEFREYERLSTTVLNAYLQPAVGDYMDRLQTKAGELVGSARISICQSSGGLMSVEEAAGFPIRTALSGPAAGAMGASAVAKLSGLRDVITLDMGGTSADVALIQDAQPAISYNRDVAGFPVRLPSIDINTVGAGGGSIAWVGPDGLFKVGPQSAGAIPGPACYSKSGTEATVSDANLFLGRLPVGGLLGGSMALDVDKARTAIAALADELDLSVERTAFGILEIVNANMVRALRAVSVERGYDPRNFALMPFGGAGALHATDVAKELGMKTVLIPKHPGILCAQGLLDAPLAKDFVSTLRLPLNEDNLSIMVERSADLHSSAVKWLSNNEVPEASQSVGLTADLRYKGQNFELSISLGNAKEPLPDLAEVHRRFYQAHEVAYGYSTEDDPLEIVNLRLHAKGQILPQIATPKLEASSDITKALRGTIPIWFSHEYSTDTPIYWRDDLGAGAVIEGAARFEQLDSTSIVPPNSRTTVDPFGNLIVEISS